MKVVTLTGEFWVGKVNFETAYPYWAGTVSPFRTVKRRTMDGLQAYRNHYQACCWPDTIAYAEQKDH